MEVKENPNYPDYLIYSDGRIFSKKTQKYLKVSVNKSNYERVGLVVNKKQIFKLVHRLVAETFLENKYDLPQVNHIDHNTRNNDVSNLEWCTAEENNAWRSFGYKQKIECTTIPVKATSRFRKMEEFVFANVCEAANKTGSNQSQIYACCRGRRKYVNGFHYEFVVN